MCPSKVHAMLVHPYVGCSRNEVMIMMEGEKCVPAFCRLCGDSASGLSRSASSIPVS